MAEKKFGLGTVLLISAGAAAVAGGVVFYIKRAEIKKLAEDIIARVKSAEDADDEPGDWDIRSGEVQEAASPEVVNIVDSGVSLESVENPEDAGEEPEAGETAEAVEEAGSEPEPEQTKKKTWFWSK